MPILKVKDNGEWKEVGEGSLVDSTLTVAGASADAKAAGDRIAQAEEALNAAKINKTGDDVSGYLDFNDTSAGLSWTTADGTEIHMRPYSPTNVFQLTMQNPSKGISEYGEVNIATDGTWDFAHPDKIRSALGISESGGDAVSARGQSNELYSSIETGWLARINTNDGTNTTTVGADETGGIYAYKNGNLVWRIPPNAHGTRWTCPVKLNEFSGICELYDYSSGLLTLVFGQTNQAVTHTYLVSTSWGHATLTQLGSNGFSSYFDQDVRIMQGSNATCFIVEVKNKYDYDGDGMLNAVCSYIPLGSESVDSAVNPYTAYTAASSGTGICSLTSKNDGIVASKFYGELVGTVSNVVAKSGDTMTGALNFANGTWNFMGDDAYIGDCNVGGCIGIKGANGNTGINFVDYNGGADGKLAWNGWNFTSSGGIYVTNPNGEGQIGVNLDNGALYLFENGTDRGIYDSGLGNYIFNTTGGTPHFYGNADYANTSGWANGANKANEMGAAYTGSGGAVGPNHTGAYTVKCHMMNQFKGTEVWFSGTGYADVLMMNAYDWADVPYATALAIAKTNGTPRAWIASGGNSDNWAGATEVVTGNNIGWWIDGKANTSHSHSFEGINITPSSNCSNASGLAKYYPDLKMVVFFACLTTQVAMTQQIYHVGSIPEQYVPNARFALSAYANKSSLGPSETSGRTAGIVSIAGFIYDDGNIYVDLGADLPSGSYIWLSGTWCTI